MRSSSVVVSAVVGLAAPVAFVVAYQSWSPSPTAMAARAPAERTLVAATTGATKVRLRPCEKGSRLRHGVCVSHEVRTVVVPVVPATRPAPPTSVSAPAHSPGYQGEQADEPTATPGPGQQDDGDDNQTQPACAVHPNETQADDSQCDDDQSTGPQEPQEPQETQDAGEDDGGEHDGSGGNGGGTGTDD